MTVLFPFLHDSRLDEATERELVELIAAHDAFELTFAEFRRYPGVLYLEPWPAGPVRALTKSVVERWPECVPYRGIFGVGGLEPHLTVDNSEPPETQERAYDALQVELAPWLPVTAAVREVLMIVWEGGRWVE
ncbi:2'-5' RNA ligase family protein, partial [Streptomyces coryli]|uniref:2'-5' RNA ligase family protein n=1 Tax=Streptomyces coryli TaxID=1128680 RepID=UPI0030B8C65C